MGLALDSGDYLSADVDYGPSAYPFTLSAWGSVTGTNLIKLIWCGDKDVTNYYLSLVAAGGSPVSAVTHNYGTATTGTASTSTNVVAGQWFHACGVWNSVSSRIAYLNGGGKVENTATVGALANHDRTGIGAELDSSPNYSVGSIAECAIWTVALTDAEIALLAARVSPLMVRPASLLRYWRCAGRSWQSAGGSSWQQCLVSGKGLQETNTPTVTDHPAISQPTGLRVWVPPAAAPPAVVLRRPQPVWLYGG